jgi:hypothetical protein
VSFRKKPRVGTSFAKLVHPLTPSFSSRRYERAPREADNIPPPSKGGPPALVREAAANSGFGAAPNFIGESRTGGAGVGNITALSGGLGVQRSREGQVVVKNQFDADHFLRIKDVSDNLKLDLAELLEKANKLDRVLDAVTIENPQQYARERSERTKERGLPNHQRQRGARERSERAKERGLPNDRRQRGASDRERSERTKERELPNDRRQRRARSREINLLLLRSLARKPPPLLRSLARDKLLLLRSLARTNLLSCAR